MDYKEKIIEMLKNIENEKYLELAYGFIKPLYEESSKADKSVEYKNA